MLVVSPPPPYFTIMTQQGNRKPAKAKNLKNDMADVKAELEKYYRQTSGVLIGENNTFITVLESGKTFELNHLSAFRELEMRDRPFEIEELPEYIGYVLEDLTEYVLEHIDVNEYQRHRKTLQACKGFFEEFLKEKKGRPRMV